MKREKRQWNLVSPEKTDTRAEHSSRNSLTMKFSMIEALLDMVQGKLDERLGNLERKARHRQFKIEAMISQSQCMLKDAEELLDIKKAAEDAKDRTTKARLARTNMLATQSVERLEIKKEQKTEIVNRSVSRDTQLSNITTKEEPQKIFKQTTSKKPLVSRPTRSRTPVVKTRESPKKSPEKSTPSKITKPRIDYGRLNKSKDKPKLPQPMEADIEPLPSPMPMTSQFGCSKCKETTMKLEKMSKIAKLIIDKKTQMENLMAEVSELTGALMELKGEENLGVEEECHSEHQVLKTVNTNSDLQSSAKPRYLSPSPVKSVKVFEGYGAKTLKGGLPQLSDDSNLRRDIRKMIRSQADKLTKENTSPLN